MNYDYFSSPAEAVPALNGTIDQVYFGGPEQFFFSSFSPAAPCGIPATEYCVSVIFNIRSYPDGGQRYPPNNEGFQAVYLGGLFGIPFGQVCTDGSYVAAGVSCGSTTQLAKLLGDPANSPYACPCVVGDPIEVASGNVYHQETDYQSAGANTLAFKRHYNSRAAASTFAIALGSNWRHNFDRYLRISSSSQVVAEREDGQQVIFSLAGGVWTPDSDVDLALVQSGAIWMLTDTNDSVETYSTITSGEATLSSIAKRGGYVQNLSYAAGHLALVTDSYGRQLSFTYSGLLLSDVTTPDGLVISYGFGSSGVSPGVNDLLTSVSYSTSPLTSRAYVYDQTGLPFALTRVIDESNNQYLTWGYDSVGRGILDQRGTVANQTLVYYNAATGGRTVTNALGVVDSYTFTTLQGVPKVAQISRAATSSTPAMTRLFTYDLNGYVAIQTDWNGNKTTFLNNSHGLPTSITEASGSSAARTTTIAYDSLFVHLPDSVATSGLTTTYAYDSAGNPVSKTLTDTTSTIVPYPTSGQTRRWTYSWLNALLASSTTPNGNTTTFSYDASGALIKTTNALGQSITVTQHTGGGLPQTLIDANGVTTSLSYDGRQRLTSSVLHTAAGLLTTSYTFDKPGNLIKVQLPDGSAITSGYDAAHRLTNVSDTLNNQIQYTLDGLGGRTATSFVNPSSVAQRKLSATFDGLGRTLQNIGGVGQTTTYVYDNNGNAATVSDPLGHSSQQTFDGLNRLSRVIDALSGITKITNDQHDRPVTVVDANSGSTTYVYNGFGDVLQRISPDSGKTLYYYDADGNVTQFIDGRGVVTNQSYDALDSVVTTTYPGNSAENVAYTYDQSGHGFGVGRLTSVSDAAGTLSRTYDERGNVLSEQRISGASTFNTAYSYDNASRIASITYPSGWLVSYTRDATGRIQAIKTAGPGAQTPAPIVSAVAWQPFGPFSSLTYGNGIAETRTFDLDYRLTALTDTASTPVLNLSYGYDLANNVAGISDGVTPTNSQSFAYDALDHLTKATGGYGSLAYTYSAIGNRLTQTVNSGTSGYTYAAHSNQLTGVTGAGAQTISYTGAGNISMITPSGGTPTTLAYSQANRLSSVTGLPLVISSMTYNAFGQRFSKTSGGSTTYFSYGQGSELIEEQNGGFSIDYIYLNGRPVGQIIPSTGKLYFLHGDRLGTPQLATDSSQSLAWSTTYQPFGQTTTLRGALTQDLRYPGQYVDVETGWNQNGYRDYAPSLGRYLEADPLGLNGGFAPYSYAISNPLRFVDQFGLCSVDDIRDYVNKLNPFYRAYSASSDLDNGPQVPGQDEASQRDLALKRQQAGIAGIQTLSSCAAAGCLEVLPTDLGSEGMIVNYGVTPVIEHVLEKKR